MELPVLIPSIPDASVEGKCRFDPEPLVDQTVCHCFEVKESTLRQAIDHHGAKSVEEITDRTGAGDGCTACHCRLLRMLAGLPAKCSGRFDLCGQCGCLAVNCECEAA